MYDEGFRVGIRKQPDIETAVVSNILDRNGELAAAVASVEAIVSCFFLFFTTEEGGGFLVY